MLCTRHFYYYRIFLAHKLVIINRSFSSWLNLPIIYGSQFRQILNRNMLFKSQQFFQCNQFCDGDDDSIHSLPIENANSSSTNSSLETSINIVNLETRWLLLKNFSNLQLKFQIGKSGQKFFHIAIIKNNIGNYFRNIPVPEDAYAFVHALNELIGELASDNFEQKLKTQETYNADHQFNKSELKLRTIELIGKHHKFELELVLFVNTDRGMLEKEICLQILALNKANAKHRILILPLPALPWLRNQMAKMLMRHDGTEVMALEAPVQIPQQFFFKQISRNAALQNGITSAAGQKSVNKEMWPQFVNKKLASFQQFSKMQTKMQNSNQNGVKNQKMSTHFAVPKKTNLKRNRMVNKNSIEPVNPQMAKLEESIRALFNFDDEEMEKYRRIAAKVKNPPKR